MPIVSERGDSNNRYGNMHSLDRHIRILLLGLSTFIEAQICDLDCGTGYSCVLRRSTCVYPPCPSFPTCLAVSPPFTLRTLLQQAGRQHIPLPGHPAKSIFSLSSSEQQSDLFAVHPGQCPNSTTSSPCIGTCRVDNDCLQNQKCCENDCGRTCRTVINNFPQQKSGSCPRRSELKSGTCQSNCATDYDCPGVQKCCSNGCASTCSEPCYYWIGQDHRLNQRIMAWKLPFICRNMSYF